MKRLTNFIKFRKKLIQDRDSYLKQTTNSFVLKEIQGSKMLLNTKDKGIHYDLIVNGIREPQSTEVIKKIITKDDVVLDVGANIGYYSLLMKKAKKVYALEPASKNYKNLELNILINKCKNIIPKNMGLGDINGTAVLNLSKRCNLNSINAKINSVGSEKITIMTLDNFAKSIPETPTFVRMDVEGYEAKIIKGMSNTLKNSKKGLKLFIEFHPGIFREPRVMVAEIIQDLVNSGLKIKYIINTEGTEFLDFSPDNILETICSEWAPGVFIEKI